MIEVVEGKILNQLDVVDCYRNLHTGNFSIRNAKSKHVVARGDSFLVTNVTPKVSEKSRQKVIREQVKNVHATLRGNFEGVIDIDVSNCDELYYNPYTTKTFINKRTGEELEYISHVYFKDNKCWIIN